MIDVSSPHACMVALESIVGNNVHCIYACMANVSYFVAWAFFPDVISINAVEVILTVLIGSFCMVLCSFICNKMPDVSISNSANSGKITWNYAY